MTVASEVNRSGPYIGNGVTTAFDYEFRIINEEHIKVIRAENGIETILTLNVDYTVSGVGDADGGSITMVVAPTAAQTITMLLNVTFTQETDLENQGAYFAQTVEDALDLAVMRDQQLSERLDRAITIPASSSGVDLAELVENTMRLVASADNVDAVAANEANINTVAASAPDIAAVLANISDVANFADVYQGAKADHPTTRNDGSPLQPGDMLFNTTSDYLEVYSGSVWVAPGGDMRGSQNLSDVADPGASIRNIGGLDLSTTVNLNAASVLTSAAFGKLHFISGVTAFTTTLPTPVGNSGKVLAFLVAAAASATKLYTILTPAGAIGRSGDHIVMWAHESVLLRSNGTNWEVLEAKQIPFVGTFTRAVDQSPSGGKAILTYPTSVIGDPTGLNLCYVNNMFKAPRAGSFTFGVYAYQTADSGTTVSRHWISNAAGTRLSGIFSWNSNINATTLSGTARLTVAEGDVITGCGEMNGVNSKINSGDPARFDFLEHVPSW